MRSLILCVLALAGCAGVTSSTPVDFVRALNENTRSNCLSISVTGMGGATGAVAGGPGVKITQNQSGCTIETVWPPAGVTPLVPTTLAPKPNP